MDAQAPWTEFKFKLVNDELQSILASPSFGSSRRSIKLLQYLVQQTLEGNLENLRERALGVQVFERDPNYDTGSDPIVRIAASDVRKRLTKFYKDQTQTPAVRIELVAGGYQPCFHFLNEIDPAEVSEEEIDTFESQDALPTVSDAEPARRSALPRKKWWIAGMALLLAATLLGVLFHRHRTEPTSLQLWKPLLDKQRKLIVCLPEFLVDSAGFDDTEKTGWAKSTNLPHLVLLEEARAAQKISNQLTTFGYRPTFEVASALTLKDFRSASVVLIGGLDNPWTLKLLSSQRYTLQIDQTTGDRWIRDAQNPFDHHWTVNKKGVDPVKAYAILTRFYDAETGSYIMSLTGTGPLGVEAAADMITASLPSSTLPDSLRTQKNFQAIIKVTVLNGFLGSPQVLTVHTW